MSIGAIQWAEAVKCGRSTAKCVLLQLARFAADESSNEFFVSVEYLCDVTEMNRKTVLEALKTLVSIGYLAETGRRGGRTGQMKIYRLNVGFPCAFSGASDDVSSHLKLVKNATNSDAKSTENGTVKESQKRDERVPFLDGKSTVFTRKESQKRDTNSNEHELEHELTTPPPTLIGEYAVALRKAGVVGVQPFNPVLRKVVADGVSLETVLAAVETAAQSLKGKQISLGYVVAILNRWAQESSSQDLRGAVAPAARSAGKVFDPLAYNNRHRIAKGGV